MLQPHLDERYRHIFEGLNDAQREVVASTEGQYAVLASAGSGKTASMTRRVAYLIAQGVPAWQILCITFTRKAANEMQGRIKAMVGDVANEIWMGTFHGICRRILYRHRDMLGFENMTIIDDGEQERIIKDVIQLVDLSQDYENVKSFIDNAQNHSLFPSDFGLDADQSLVNIYRGYQERKKELGYIDFNDIILFTVYLLKTNDAIRARYQNQFHYVMCDESQDTNNCQFELLSLLSGKHGNLALIGDDLQSIYKFRGSRVQNIIGYSTNPDIKTLLMEQNYRSTKTIIEASNHLVTHNKVRLQKSSFTENKDGDYVIVYPASDTAREADFVAEMIKRMVQRENRTHGEFAILFRNNYQSRELEMAFRQQRIPYNLVKGTTFFDRKEIKDIVGYLRSVDNPVDSLAFERIINVPKRGIGAKAIERINDYAQDANLPFAKVLYHIDEVPKLTKKAVEAVKDFTNIIDRLQAYSRTEGALVSKCIEMVLHETKFLEQFEVGKNQEEDKARIQNIVDLVDMAKDWESHDEGTDETPMLTRFLAETSLDAELDTDNDHDVVQMMSVHSSKGLEFPVVFVVGMEEGKFPSPFAKTEADIEEERRLLYVAMTRAEERLFLSYSKTRTDYKSGGMAPTEVSRFLKELPRNLLHIIGVDNKNGS